MIKKISQFDWFIYKLFYWRWNRIFKERADLRELFIANLKAFDVLDEGEKVIVTITKCKGY